MDYSAIGLIVGICMFFSACKNLLKIYKEKSLIIKVGICIGLFIVSMIITIISIIILLAFLNPNVTFEQAGEQVGRVLIIFIGFFASIISQISCFIHFKKHNKKQPDEYKSARNKLIFSIVLLLIVFISIQVSFQNNDDITRDLLPGEYSDGRMAFMKPADFNITKIFVGTFPAYVMTLDERVSLTIISGIANGSTNKMSFERLYELYYGGLIKGLVDLGYDESHTHGYSENNGTSNLGFDYIEKSVFVEGYILGVLVVFDKTPEKSAVIVYMGPPDFDTWSKFKDELMNSVKFD